MMSETITEPVIKKVAEKTGASVEKVGEIAEKYGELIVRASRVGLISLWAVFRCITCLGIVRKIFWCLVATISK